LWPRSVAILKTMSQVFHRSTNTISKLSIYGFVFIVAGLGWVWLTLNRSSYMTGVNVALSQPVPFSHKHHVEAMGIDCRYCHTSVEDSSFAGIPSTKTCMTCHSQIWATSPMLEPVRESFRTDRPVRWVRVHDLPDFVYFNHSIHVKKGIACETCHGRVDQMPLVWQEKSLQMEWCLECHRQPERFVRPREAVFEFGWHPPAGETAMGAQLVNDYRIRKVDYCSACHR
jgi:hypothetical protein